MDIIQPFTFVNQNNGLEHFVSENEHIPFNLGVNLSTSQHIPNNVLNSLFLKEADFHHKVEIENLHHFYRNQEIDKKEQNKIKYLETIENNRINRENATFSAFEDSDGYIRIQRKSPDGKENISQPILSNRYFRMTIYEESGQSCDKVAFIFWMDSSNIQKSIKLTYEDFCAKGFKRELEKSGVVIHSATNNKAFMAELVFEFLCINSTRKILPKSLGWNNVEGNWFFASSINETLEGLKHE